MEINSKFLTFKEACDFLKVGANQLGNLCRCGKITFYKGVGRTSRYRFKERDLMAYMDKYEKRDTTTLNSQA